MPSEFTGIIRLVNIKKDKKLTVRVCEEVYKVIKLKADLPDMSLSRFLVEKVKNSYVDGYSNVKKCYKRRINNYRK